MFNVYLKNEEFAEPKDQIYYLVTASGIFLVKRNSFFCSSVKVEGISLLKEHKEFLKLCLPKEIPYRLMAQIVDFFKKVFCKFKGEAIALIYYSLNNNEYKVVIPEQKVTRGGCNYKVKQKMPSDCLLFATCHSHADIDAFHSPIDDKDEKHCDGFHITVGNVDILPTFSCSAVVGGRRFKVKPSDLIEGMAEQEMPKEWLNCVKKGKEVIYRGRIPVRRLISGAKGKNGSQEDKDGEPDGLFDGDGGE